MGNILKIARFELKRTRLVYDRKVLMVLVPSLVLILVFFFFFLRSGDFYSNSFYVANADPSLGPIFDLNGKFIVMQDDTKDSDLTIVYGREMYIHNQRDFRSYAATESLIKSIKLYNAFIFSEFPEIERDPVLVQTELLRRDENVTSKINDLGSLQDSKDAVANTGDVQSADILGGSSPISSYSGSERRSDPEPLGKPIEIEDLSDISPQNKKDTRDPGLKTPSEISPAMPFEPVYLALTIIVLFTFMTLTYSNRIYDEKVNKKGTLLLVSPLKTYEIIIGKTLPHLLLSMILAVGVSLFHTQNISSLILLLPLLLSILLVYLSIAFLIAMLSRSFKELSFIGIFSISIYSLYLLIPAFMISFTQASLASPLTIVVKLLLEEEVGLKLFLFAIVPQMVIALILFFIGYLIFTGEDLFSYKSISEKLIDVYENFLKKPYYLIFSSAAVVPFVFIVELLLIVLLISIQNDKIIFYVLLLSAFVEEIFKAIGIYAVYKRGLFIDRKGKGKELNYSGKKSFFKRLLYRKSPLWIGIFTGLGFFLGEKAMLLIMISSFIKEYALIIFAGLLIPLALHILLSILIAYSLSRWKNSFIPIIILASLLHFAANLALSRGLSP